MGTISWVVSADLENARLFRDWAWVSNQTFRRYKVRLPTVLQHPLDRWTLQWRCLHSPLGPSQWTRTQELTRKHGSYQWVSEGLTERAEPFRVKMLQGRETLSHDVGTEQQRISSLPLQGLRTRAQHPHPGNLLLEPGRWLGVGSHQELRKKRTVRGACAEKALMTLLFMQSFPSRRVMFH